MINWSIVDASGLQSQCVIGKAYPAHIVGSQFFVEFQYTLKLQSSGNPAAVQEVIFLSFTGSYFSLRAIRFLSTSLPWTSMVNLQRCSLNALG